MSTIKPVRKADIVVKDIGEETLLYNTNDEAIHVLNPTAKLIWELCDGEHTIKDMEQVIVESFSIPDERVVIGDIQRTLQMFADKKLLKESV